MIGASASSSHAEMRAYYVDPGSSVYQSGKIIAIDVVKMKVYKSIDYPDANTTMLNRMFFVFIIIFLLKVTAELYTKYIYKQKKFK
jgi:hypothetical protein